MLETFITNNQGQIMRFLITFIVGYGVIKLILLLLSKSTLTRRIDKTVAGFIRGLIRFLLFSAYIIILLSIVGVPMTSFIAMFSAIGLAIALALQGNLANFASALILLVFKPFKSGDFVETGSYMGTVQDIQLFFTTINTPDNRRIIVPNSDLVNSKVVNYTAMENRRVDMVFSAGYEDDVDEVIALLMKVVKGNELILEEPLPVVRLTNHGASALEYDVKVWAKKEEYLNVKYQMNEDVRKVFRDHKISIPYPQREVWLNQR